MTGDSCNMRDWECKKCGLKWIQVSILKPKCCPLCGSKKWAKPTKEEKDRDKDIARVQAVKPWIMEKIKTTKNGSKTYRYWMASWREGGKVRHVHLGSCEKITSYDVAYYVAMTYKAKALGIEW